MCNLGTGSAKSRVPGRKRCIWAGLLVRRREGSGMRKRLARRIFQLQRSAKKIVPVLIRLVIIEFGEP